MNPRTTISVVALTSLLIAAIVIYVGWLPLLSELDTLRTARQSEAQQALAEQARLTALQDLLPRKADLEKTINVLEDSYAHDEDPLRIILPLEQIATAQGTGISIEFLDELPDITRQPVARGSQNASKESAPASRPDAFAAYAAIPVEVTFTGSYAQLIRAIQSVEQLPLASEIMQLSFSLPDAARTTEEVLPSATIVVRFFLSPSSS